jgi:hypothetical protein
MVESGLFTAFGNSYCWMYQERLDGIISDQAVFY